jgi:hypothetical protein
MRPGRGRRSVASRPHPALFYRRAFEGGEATIGALLSRERLNTAGGCTSAGRGRKRVIVPNPRDSWDWRARVRTLHGFPGFARRRHTYKLDRRARPFRTGLGRIDLLQNFVAYSYT